MTTPLIQHNIIVIIIIIILFLGDQRDFQDYKNKNNVIREKVNIKNSVLDYIKYKHLNWYGRVRRINEERLPQNILNCVQLKEEENEDLEIRGFRK